MRLASLKLKNMVTADSEGQLKSSRARIHFEQGYV